MKRLALPSWIRGRSKTTRTTTMASDGKPLGRNDPCPCGSGKKFKQCCWGKVRVEGSRWSRKAVLLVFLAGAVITLAGLNLRRELGGGEPSRRGPTTAPATIPLGTIPLGTTPAPWQYDAVNNQHWDPGHGHWHSGPPPIGGIPGANTQLPATTQPGSTPAPWEYDAVNNQHWDPGHGHWHSGPPPPGR